MSASKTEIVRHTFPPPAEDTEVWAEKVVTSGHDHFVVIRAKDVASIHDYLARKLAYEAITELPTYTGCGVEAVGGAYAVDPETGQSIPNPPAYKKGETPPYEFARVFKINPSLERGMF